MAADPRVEATSTLSIRTIQPPLLNLWRYGEKQVRVVVEHCEWQRDDNAQDVTDNVVQLNAIPCYTTPACNSSPCAIACRVPLSRKLYTASGRHCLHSEMDRYCV